MSSAKRYPIFDSDLFLISSLVPHLHVRACVRECVRAQQAYVLSSHTVSCRNACRLTRLHTCCPCTWRYKCSSTCPSTWRYKCSSACPCTCPHSRMLMFAHASMEILFTQVFTHAVSTHVHAHVDKRVVAHVDTRVGWQMYPAFQAPEFGGSSSWGQNIFFWR